MVDENRMIAAANCNRFQGVEFKFSPVSTDARKSECLYSFECVCFFSIYKQPVNVNYRLPSDMSDEKGGVFSGTGADADVAQRNCALAVCRHLKAIGLLSSTALWGARRGLEDNDFYEEDEDDFYDRTGQIEAQRIKRIQRHKVRLYL